MKKKDDGDEQQANKEEEEMAYFFQWWKNESSDGVQMGKANWLTKAMDTCSYFPVEILDSNQK